MFSYPQQVEAIWALGTDREAIIASQAFQSLSEQVQQEAKRWAVKYRSQDQLEQRLLQKLLDVYDYVSRQADEARPSVADVLQILRDRLIGPGYYQFEIIRRLFGLQEADDAP
jgi:hypothetical protein